MTKEQKDKILKLMTEERNDYASNCELRIAEKRERIAEERGKIIGADCMLQSLLGVLETEVEPQERSEKK